MTALKTYQHQAIEFMRERDWSILALDMRMGKSACALFDAESAARLLIICPVISTIPWLREIEKWSPDRVDRGVQILTQHASVVDPHCHTHILPYSLLDTFRASLLPQPDYMVVDEMHYVKNPDTLRTKVVTTLMRKVPRGSLLSGTPMPSRPAELWPVLSTLGVFKNKDHYDRRYCAGHMTEWGWDNRGASNLDELADELATVMFRRTKKDLKGEWAEVQRPLVIELDLPLDEQEKEFSRSAIEKMDHALVFETVSDLLHRNALRKIPLAIEHIRNVLETEQKVVVFAWHRDVIQELDKAFLGPAIIHGGHSAKQRAQAVRWFQEDPGCRVMIANYQAAGESITLDAASYVIFVECSWVPKDIHQPVARCSGHGQSETVRVDILTIHKSVDAHVLHKVLMKEDHIDQVVKETVMPKDIKISTLDVTIRALIEAQAAEKAVTQLAYLTALFPKAFEAEEEEVVVDEPKKKKATKKKAAKKEEVPVAEEKDTGVLIDGDDEEAEEAEEIKEDDDITLDRLRLEMADTMQLIGPAPIRDALKKLGANKLSDLTEEQYQNMWDVCLELKDEFYALS